MEVGICGKKNHACLVAKRGFAELSNMHQIKNRLMQDPYVLYTFEMVDSAFFFCF